MKVVYVAGPYRAANAWLVEGNVRRAEALALEVWRMGAVAICPHTLSRFYQGAAPDEVWLKGDLELVRRSDAVLMVPGWERSIGSVGEETYARELGLPVLKTLQALRLWLQASPVMELR